MRNSWLKDIYRFIGAAIESHPWTTLVLTFVLLLAAFNGATQITSVTGNEAFVSDRPDLERFQDEFDRSRIALLVRGDITHPDTIQSIQRFDDRMTRADNVESVTSPADQVVEKYGRIPENKSAIKAVIGSPEYTVVNVVTEPGLTQEQQRPIYTESVDTKEWVEFPSGNQVTITGAPAFSSQLSQLIQQSTGSLLGLAVLLMILILFLVFRGVHLRLLPIVVVFVGVIYTFGAMGYLGTPNSTLTSAVFPILIGLGIDYSVQFHTRYEEELTKHPPSHALPQALSGIGPAVLIAMTSAGLGFTATAVTNLETPALVWFSQTSIIGILMSYLTGLTGLTAALTIYVHWKRNSDKDTGKDTDSKDKPQNDERESRDVGRGGGTDPQLESRDTPLDDLGWYAAASGRMSRGLARHPALVLFLAGVLTVGGFYAGSQVDALTDTNDFVPQDLPALVSLQNFQSLTGGGSAVRFDVLLKGDVFEPESLEWMRRFERVVSGKPTVTGVESPVDSVTRYSDGEIPETREGVLRAVERMPEGVRNQFFSSGYGHLTVLAKQGMDSRETLSFVDVTTNAISLSRPPPGLEAVLTGSSVVSTGSILETIENRNRTTFIGVILVFTLLLLYYRHPVLSLAPIVPMLFVVGWQGIFTYFAGISISPLSASLGALTVGIGAEYTIIVTERFVEERRKGVERFEAVQIASSKVGKAITVSGITTVFGFSALILSPFPLLSDFGLITVGVISLTLVAALTTLPPVLVVLDEAAEKLGYTYRS